MGPGGETGARAVQHLRALSSVCSLLCLLVGTPFVANTDTEDASREIENKHKHARVIGAISAATRRFPLNCLE